MKISLYGFGAINRLIARLAIERNYEIIGVIDIDPSIVGRDVGELIGIEKLGLYISKSVDVIQKSDVVIHATSSYLDKIYDQILTVIKMGIDVVSTCETLVYPYYRYPVLARKLNKIALDNSVSVIGTGINPGFLLDTLIVTLSMPFTFVKKIKAVRSIDAAKRRESFRKKIGVGEDIKIVEEKLRKKEITAHVGYAESVMLIADGFEINLSKIVEDQKIVLAEEEIESADVKAGKGKVKGVVGYGAGYIDDKEVIRLEFHAYVGAQEFEEITIEGKDYTVVWKSTGTPGDLGTAAIVLNIAEVVNNFEPGLKTMIDLIPFKPRFTTNF